MLLNPAAHLGLATLTSKPRLPMHNRSSQHAFSRTPPKLLRQVHPPRCRWRRLAVYAKHLRVERRSTWQGKRGGLAPLAPFQGLVASLLGAGEWGCGRATERGMVGDE